MKDNSTKTEDKELSNETELDVRAISGPTKIKIENFFKIIGAVVAIFSLLFTSLNYYSSQKWKVAEFTSEKYKEFSENKAVIITNMLLDYNTRSVPLFTKDSFILIDDIILYEALVLDTINGSFSKIEAKLRDVFDEYFDQLSLFNRYVKADLMEYDEIKPYLNYQVKIIADTANSRKSNDLRYRIWNYIEYYQFEDVTELYEGIGYPINIK